jgi:hypothetical protein
MSMGRLGKQDSEENMGIKTYQVESPIKHNGKEYGVGEPIDLDDKEAKALKEVGAISDAVASNTPTAPTDEAERIAAIVEAIGKLDAKNAALWTKNGVPQIPALSEITGWQVAGKDRDAAWEQINAAK